MRYRIVRDNYAGWEVQVKRWYFPFWYQYRSTNTHLTRADAEAWFKVFTDKGQKV